MVLNIECENKIVVTQGNMKQVHFKRLKYLLISNKNCEAKQKLNSM